jgi:hypothetical protein
MSWEKIAAEIGVAASTLRATATGSRMETDGGADYGGAGGRSPAGSARE